LRQSLMRRKKCARRGMRCYSCKASDGKIRWHACGKPGEIHFNNSETKQKQFANKTSLWYRQQMKHRSLQKREKKSKLSKMKSNNWNWKSIDLRWIHNKKEPFDSFSIFKIDLLGRRSCLFSFF
jgi:hypothetical protein